MMPSRLEGTTTFLDFNAVYFCLEGESQSEFDLTRRTK